MAAVAVAVAVVVRVCAVSCDSVLWRVCCVWCQGVKGVVHGRTTQLAVSHTGPAPGWQCQISVAISNLRISNLGISVSSPLISGHSGGCSCSGWLRCHLSSPPLLGAPPALVLLPVLHDLRR